MTESENPTTGPSVREEVEQMRPKPRNDRQIWGIYFCLVCISLVELYSASSREVVAGNILAPLFRHGVLLFLGFVIMVVMQRIHYRYYRNWTGIIVLLCIAATLYTMKFGLVINGARRSFSFLGLFTVQPSELLKFASALVIAYLLRDYHINYTPGHEEEEKRENRRRVAWVSGIVLLFCGMLVNQGLTNTLLLFVISISMMVICGVRWKEWFAVLGIYAILGCGYVGYKLLSSDDNRDDQPTELVAGQERDRTDMRVQRVLNFLRTDKYKDTINSENQQEQYAFIAQANGGVFGVFPGNSRETARLPLAFSDYIYAIVVEDGGLFLGTIVLLLYMWLLARAGRIAYDCRKAYPALLVIGMAVFISCQALMHMGIVSGALPVSGQPLPLISKGGSSVIITSVALGMMLSVSRHALRRSKKAEMRDQLNALEDEDDEALNATEIKNA